jgi:hypothetical protein
VAGIGSSALIESVARGIPAICLATGNVPTEIPVPSWVDPRLSRVTYDARETAQAITAMMDNPVSGANLLHLHESMLGTDNFALMRRLLEPDQERW